MLSSIKLILTTIGECHYMWQLVTIGINYYYYFFFKFKSLG